MVIYRSCYETGMYLVGSCKPFFAMSDCEPVLVVKVGIISLSVRFIYWRLFVRIMFVCLWELFFYVGMRAVVNVGSRLYCPLLLPLVKL